LRVEIPRKGYQNVCWYCKREVKSGTNQRCPACRLLICSFCMSCKLPERPVISPWDGELTEVPDCRPQIQRIGSNEFARRKDWYLSQCGNPLGRYETK
jgi:hypothetical protein